MYKEHRVAVVIPAFKVEKFIRNTIEGLPSFVDRIYVIDDGSPDGTADVVLSLNHSRVNLIRHETNRGPGAALSTGYQAALADNMDIAVKVDGDGQMPPEQIENLILPLVEGRADYTKGDRLCNSEYCQSMPRFRLFGNRMLTWLTRLASGYWHLSDAQNGFTAISKKALQSINQNLYPYYGYLNDLLAQLNVHRFEVIDIPMPAKYGSEKSSIKYRVYIPKVSFLLLRRFLWRLWKKYLRR